MPAEKLGHAGAYCPKHNERLPDISDANMHYAFVCDLCGDVIKTTLCPACKEEDADWQHCRECGRMCCESCGMQVSIGMRHSGSFRCRECLERGQSPDYRRYLHREAGRE